MKINSKKDKMIIGILGLLAIGFGIMTIKSGGFALFGGEAGKQFAGKFVPFVLWFNFIGGFFYVIFGIGIFLKKKWAFSLAITLAITTLLVFIGFGIHVYSGKSYEIRTVGAMTLRSIFWILISILSRNRFLVQTST
ncbi:hypothetical protein [Halobacteriovorax sp. JY17]|uniref:hypothetical protein n=1 Tax=Halobacteriovorax sp. JY17 TaxID=2014617 RepID=UPI000C61ECA3|nr:hypothetical protein [Halobacteriovorax sp. JY17]PIK16428.1 MAG: hypothetical protein CES88_06720 [Halobacteriovorax sp. JY17]